MQALCVRVILGSATHYSNPVWVVLCEEWICQCVHFVYVFVSCACSGLRVTYHPSDRKWICCKFINSLASLFSFNDQLQSNNQPIQSPRLWGNENQSKCSFSIGHLQCCTWILERMSIQNAMVLESLESNAKLHHLALPTMLSALKHDWGILALFVVVNWSQPNHTRLAV